MTKPVAFKSRALISYSHADTNAAKWLHRVTLADRLAKADPGYEGWQRDPAVGHAKVATVLAARLVGWRTRRLSGGARHHRQVAGEIPG